MITSDSRYATAAHGFAVCHLYDVVGSPETVEVTNQVIPPGTTTGTDAPTTTTTSAADQLTEVSRDTTYLLTTAQGDIAPHSYMVKITDNIQLLAYRSLQDPTQWWVIADANPHIRYPFDFTMGKTIHLPE